MKNKIYAFLSFLVIVLVVGSFAYVTNFLFETNRYIFSVNEAVVKEKTTVVDKAGFESVIEKLIVKEVSGAEKFQVKKSPAIEEETPSETPPAGDILAPSPSLSPLPDVSPSSSPGVLDGTEIPVPGPGQ